MDSSNIVSILVGPSIWWLYVSIAYLNYGLYQAVKPRGKVMVIPMQQVDKTWFAGKPQYIRAIGGKVKWRRRKGEAHLIERNLAGYIQTGWFSHPVLFFNVLKTRGMKPDFEQIKDSASEEHGSPRNPDSDTFDDFALEEAYRQAKKANSISKPDIGMLLLVGIAAASIAGLIAFLAHPATCPPGFSCTPIAGYGSNGAVTTAIHNATSFINSTSTQTNPFHPVVPGP